MIPYSVQGSDAPFNLGFALAMALALPAGSYVAMNGRVFPWDNVTKDRAEGKTGIDRPAPAYLTGDALGKLLCHLQLVARRDAPKSVHGPALFVQAN